MPNLFFLFDLNDKLKPMGCKIIFNLTHRQYDSLSMTKILEHFPEVLQMKNI